METIKAPKWFYRFYAKTAIRWIDWLLKRNGVNPNHYGSDVESGWQAVKGFLEYKIINK